MLRWLVVLAVTTSTARADDDHLYTCKEATPDTKIAVTFKPDASLRDLTVWLAGFTCRSVVFSSDVVRAAPTVTIISPRTLTPKQALQLFVDAVEATGRRTLVLAGMETDVCVCHSALGMLDRGYAVAVDADATFSPGAAHEHGLRRVAEAGATVIHAKGVYYEWVRTLEAARAFVRAHPDLAEPPGFRL